MADGFAVCEGRGVDGWWVCGVCKQGCLGEGLFLGWSFEKALFYFV
ncbi:hypothetical protein [Bartonella vinsonii]|uniref:Uncharacterized protein n=1 Tax=Bartonella vinsonii TaxID=33047 RepID=A0A448V3Q7_BARVI|nr:hypothetical protein [Bartonella vinsonii]VEJ44405.1 Uncharacterised protein [Bartonella vinsonii]